jgi:pimeloyl-ACP methyl ester carboxylesterase
VFDDCAKWNVPTADPAVREQTHSDIPVLMLEGSLDAVTPVTFAEAAASGLSNSRTLVFPGAGHGVMSWSPKCAVTVMNNFLNEPQGFDDSCVNSV